MDAFSFGLKYNDYTLNFLTITGDQELVERVIVARWRDHLDLWALNHKAQAKLSSVVKHETVLIKFQRLLIRACV